ncbi:MAG TPA: flippase [Longimicrobiales bacterium]|nr:flippase [Longimicrobiales bacterium]
MSQRLPPPRRPSLARNSTWNLLGQGLPLLIGLVAIPVTVRSLGLIGFGLLALCWTVVGYFNFFDLGFGRAVVKRVSEASAAGDAAQVSRIATAAAAVQVGLGALAGLVLWSTAASLADLILAGDDAAVQAQATVVLRLLALAVPAVLLSNSYRAVLEGLQRFDRVNLIRVPYASANYLVPLAGALLGWGLEGIVVGLVVARYTAVAAYFLACRSAGAFTAFGRAEVRSLARFGGWVALSNAVIPLTVTLERYMVSGLRGPVDFAYYSAPAEVVLRILIIPTAFSVALFPLLSELFQQRRAKEAVAAITQALRSVMLLLAPPLAVLVLLAEPLLALWLGDDFAAISGTVLRVLCLAVFINAVAFITSAATEAAGRPDLIARYHVLELPLYLALLFAIVPAWGVVGAAWAVVLRMVVMTAVLAVFAARTAPLALGALLSTCGRAAAASSALLLGAWLIATQFDASLAGGAVLVVSYGAVVWLGVLTPHERNRVRRGYRSVHLSS